MSRPRTLWAHLVLVAHPVGLLQMMMFSASHTAPHGWQAIADARQFTMWAHAHAVPHILREVAAKMDEIPKS